MIPLVKVLVCGGRDYDNRLYVFDTLDRLKLEISRPFILIEGGARGADRLAAQWAKARGNPHARVEANWDVYGQAAGPIRNGWMLELVPNLVLAFPGGPGTANMVRIASNAGIPVRAA